MENTLKQLFSFQKFEQNESLQKIINDTELRYGLRELSMNEMELVAAAGTANPQRNGKGDMKNGRA